MGMFDRLRSLTNSELSNGEFVLVSAEYIGRVDSAQYGENYKANVLCREVGQSASETYVVFGVLADQVSRMQADDIPAVVRITQDGQANVWEKVRDLGPQD